MSTHAERIAGIEEGLPARIVARRAPGGLLVEVAGHDYTAYRACPLGCRPEPEDLFLAGLVTCSALGFESYLRRHNLSVERLRLDAQIGRTPDGRRRVTLRPFLPVAAREIDQEAFCLELMTYCARYAPARCDIEVDIDVVAAEIPAVDLVASGSARDGS